MIILAISPGTGFEEASWHRVLASGIDAVMIREKALGSRALLDLVRRVQDWTPGLRIWVNGRLEVALAAQCGLHVPEAYPEIPDSWLPISRPLHEPSQFDTRRGARQLILSPVFETPGKGPTLGVAGLHRRLEAMPPFDGHLLALGGITPENCRGVRHPRLAGVAMIRSLWQAPDPLGVVTRLRESWR